MHGLLVHDAGYSALYALCKRHFPDVAQDLAKPVAHLFRPSSTLANQACANPTSSQSPSTIILEPATAAPPPASYWYRLPPTPATLNVPQPWPRTPAQAPVPPHFPSADPAAFFHARPRSDACAFGNQLGHRLRECPIAQEYVHSGRATLRNGQIHLPNGDPVPNDGTSRGLQVVIDAFLLAAPYSIISFPSPASCFYS